VSSGSPKGGIKPEELSFSVLEAATKKSHGQQLKKLKIRGIATKVRLPGLGIRYETSEHFITDPGQRRIPCPDRFTVGRCLRQHLVGVEIGGGDFGAVEGLVAFAFV
jgi:hypothetical protein